LRVDALHRWGGRVKFWMEEWTSTSRSSPCQISPHRCKDKGIWPQNCKFTEILLTFGILTPHRSVSLARFSRHLQGLYFISGCVSWWNLDGFPQAVTELWFKAKADGFPPNFQHPYSGETRRRTPNIFEVQERARGFLSPAQFCGARTLPATGAAKTSRFCLCVCVYVTLVNDATCAHDIATKPSEYINDFHTIG